MQVFEDDEDGLPGSEPSEELCKVPEKSRLQLGGIGARRPPAPLSTRRETREQVAKIGRASSREDGKRRGIQLAHERRQRIREERVRHSGLYRIGATNGNRETALRRLLDDGIRQPRFADTTLAGDDHGAATTSVGALKSSGEYCQLGTASGERH